MRDMAAGGSGSRDRERQSSALNVRGGREAEGE